MTSGPVTLRGGRLFDGTQLLEGHAIRLENGVVSDICINAEMPKDGEEIDLNGDILSPGYVDLQVNGGGGVMFNNAPSVATLRRMADAHRGLGVTTLLPTLITDTQEITQAAIEATREAIAEGVPGIAGLHLEGPHLSLARKGAHDADLIRPMDPADLEMLLSAAEALPVLKVTVAPESVSETQVETLAAAGVLVSIGHSDADYATCRRYMSAGARCVTHLFNAMSQLGNREPGLVGAALAAPNVAAGMIADGVHVHPEMMRTAWRAKRAPGQLFLVSDAMAVAGTSETSFKLNGRTILRKDGQLRLEDGTLAGADLHLTRAISVLVKDVGVDLADALSAATRIPAELCGVKGATLVVGMTRAEDVIRISSDLSGAEPMHLEAPDRNGGRIQ